MQSITIIAASAVDSVTDVDSDSRYEVPGGPAFWIASALEKLTCLYSLVTNAAPTVVRIVIHNQVETGSVASISKIQLPATLPSSQLTLVSTISDEFPLALVAHLQGVVAIDLQGYIRSAQTQKQILSFTTEVLEKIAIVKVTKDEAASLSPQVYSALQQKIVLETQGKDGLVLYVQGKQFVIKGNELNPRNTLGSGDTLLAAFCANYLQTNDAVSSAGAAIKFVEIFLAEK